MNTRTFLTVLVAFTLCSCLSQSVPPQVRWFLPEVPSTQPHSTEYSQPLRVLPLTASSHLRRGMVWRLSDVELFIEEQENWGGMPTEIVGLAIQAALFESGAFVSAIELDAPTLALEVRAFEGAYGSPDSALLEVFAVYEAGDLVHQRAFRTAMPLESREAEELARAMGLALQQLATEVQEWALSSS